VADLTAYVSATELKAAMPDVIGTTTTTYDGILSTLAQRASRVIDELLGYGDMNLPAAFDAATTATDRYYSGNGQDWLSVEPCVAITTVAVKVAEASADWTAWAAGDWDKAAGGEADPNYNAGFYDLLLVNPGISKTFTRGRKTVKVTARFGRTDSPPAIIVQATIMLAARWFKRGQQAFQDTGANAELGQLTYTKGLDPEMDKLLLKASGLARYRL
jgi:hypothetical protein